MEQGAYDLHGSADASIVGCIIKIQNVFFPVLTYTVCPGNEATNWWSVCNLVQVIVSVCSHSRPIALPGL